MKVLLVDDDSDLLDVTSYALRREGYEVIMAIDGPTALVKWKKDNPDVVVLDVGLPRMSGFEVCQRIREESLTPVVLLTALSDEAHIVRGFRLGADDYVTKPFSPRILALRIRALLRRRAITEQLGMPRQLQVGCFMLDMESHEVCHNERRVQLTSIEFKLFHLLASNAGRVVPSTRLIEYAWGLEGGDASLLKTHISHIRSKLGLAATGKDSISALTRVGYRLNLSPSNKSMGELLLTHRSGDTAANTAP